MERGMYGNYILGCKYFVIHPIMPFGTGAEPDSEMFYKLNYEFFKSLIPTAEKYGVVICVENMPSEKEKEAQGNHLYGSCALNISALAQKLNCGICWDVGHANVSGYKMSEQMEILRGKIDVLHIHDNHGARDEHLLPFEANVDWQDVAEGIKRADFGGILDVEVTAWALSGDREIRENFGKTIVSRAHRLMEMADLIG
jgi:sugar phosphate isomerase/epimerase